MFRDDRDALVEKVDALRAENERLRVENDALRSEILARRQAGSPFRPANVYQGAPIADGERAALTRHELRAYPVWKLVTWHVLTLGIASFVRFNLMHDRLPKAEHDDPSAFKAIALHLVPYFNLYWVFFNGLRLYDRIAFQLRARGESMGVDRSLVTAAGVTSVIPYMNLILAPILWLIVAIKLQHAVNRIVAIDEERERAYGEPARAELPPPAAFAPLAEPARVTPVRVVTAPRDDDGAAALEEAEALEEDLSAPVAARRP